MNARHPPRAAPPRPASQAIMRQMWMAMWSALAVAAVTRLGIVDILVASAPQASAACARAIDADAIALPRLLHTLVSLRSLVQPHPQTYGLSVGHVLVHHRAVLLGRKLTRVTSGEQRTASEGMRSSLHATQGQNTMRH